MNRKYLGISILSLLTLLTVMCRLPSRATPAPILEPTATSLPVSTATPVITNTDTTAPDGMLEPGIGGPLSIRGTVRDAAGRIVPNVHVLLQVYGAEGGWDIGQFAHLELITDETGFYSFDDVVGLESGHYEIWFNGGQEYGKLYESSGYYIEAENVTGNPYILDVTVHAVTNSVFSGVIQYEDVDGAIRSFYSPPFMKPEPGHSIELFRGGPEQPEYGLGGEYARFENGMIEWSGLAGGTYHLLFNFRLSNGVLVQCTSPAFEILPGETKHMDYTIQDCPPSTIPVLP